MASVFMLHKYKDITVDINTRLKGNQLQRLTCLLSQKDEYNKRIKLLFGFFIWELLQRLQTSSQTGSLCVLVYRKERSWSVSQDPHGIIIPPAGELGKA